MVEYACYLYAVRSKAMVLLLLILCSLLLQLFVGILCLVLVLFFSTLSPSSFATILMGSRELVPLLYLSSWCLVAVYALWLFLKAPWVGLQCVSK